jgi:hypothetical protein
LLVVSSAIRSIVLLPYGRNINTSVPYERTSPAGSSVSDNIR